MPASVLPDTDPMARAIAALPPVLRSLLDAELRAGNRVVDVGHSFPAPPVGAFLQLAHPVSTRPRASGGGIRFRARLGGTYAAEYTDDHGIYFLLDPPGDAPPPPDMDAVRAAHAAASPSTGQTPMDPRRDTVRRFAVSMHIGYEQWHDGVGYDLDMLASATPRERQAIEALLLARPPSDWRDVEALARLDTPRTRSVLAGLLDDGPLPLQLAVLQYHGVPAADSRRAAILVRALEEADFYTGLTQALDQVAAFHPPVVVEALWRGLALREGPAAVHFAALLFHLHGHARSRFDWSERPLFLRFHCERGAARGTAIAALRARMAARDPSDK